MRFPPFPDPPKQADAPGKRHRIWTRIFENIRQQLTRAQAADEHIVVEAPRAFYLRADDGAYWQVSAANNGTLTTSNTGTEPPT